MLWLSRPVHVGLRGTGGLTIRIFESPGVAPRPFMVHAASAT